MENDNANRTSRFEIDPNIKMDSLGSETKPPEMEGTKPLPSRKSSNNALSHPSEFFEVEPRSNPTQPSPALPQTNYSHKWQLSDKAQPPLA